MKRKNKIWVLLTLSFAAYFSMGDGGCSPPSNSDSTYKEYKYQNADICKMDKPFYWKGNAGYKYAIYKYWNNGMKYSEYSSGYYSSPILLDCQKDSTEYYWISTYKK